MRVNIRLKQNLLIKIKSTPRQMFLGNHIVGQKFEEMDISDKHLNSTQCKHWMEVEKIKSVKKKAKAKAKVETLPSDLVEPKRGKKKEIE